MYSTRNRRRRGPSPARTTRHRQHAAGGRARTPDEPAPPAVPPPHRDRAPLKGVFTTLRPELQRAVDEAQLKLDRAIADVRDGFKPVHRRILFAMHDMGMIAEMREIAPRKSPRGVF